MVLKYHSHFSKELNSSLPFSKRGDRTGLRAGVTLRRRNIFFLHGNRKQEGPSRAEDCREGRGKPTVAFIPNILNVFSVPTAGRGGGSWAVGAPVWVCERIGYVGAMGFPSASIQRDKKQPETRKIWYLNLSLTTSLRNL